MSDYKRITRRNEDGTTWVKCVCCENVATCDYTKESYCQVLQNRLAELEDMIEQNVLIKLPCKVGDTLYYCGKTTKRENGEWQNDYFITSCYVAQIDIRIDVDTKPTLRIELLTDKLGLMIWNCQYEKTQFFNTKAEAEAELAKLKRGEKQ